MTNAELDNMDLKIIALLSEDSRRSHRELSRKLEVSVGTVSNRISKLEQRGIIRGYTIIKDFEMLGYDLTAIIGLRVSKGKLIEVAETISAIKNVIGVYDVTGEYDTIILAKFKGRNDLNEFVKKLLAMDYVERTNTHLALNTVKENISLV
jgi:DNA-binding Lrp family transcriptional regulator